MLQILKSYAGEGRQMRLVDFDDHLDDIKRWGNSRCVLSVSHTGNRTHDLSADDTSHRLVRRDWANPDLFN